MEQNKKRKRKILIGGLFGLSAAGIITAGVFVPIKYSSNKQEEKWILPIPEGTYYLKADGSYTSNKTLADGYIFEQKSKIFNIEISNLEPGLDFNEEFVKWHQIDAGRLEVKPTIDGVKINSLEGGHEYDVSKFEWKLKKLGRLEKHPSMDGHEITTLPGLAQYNEDYWTYKKPPLVKSTNITSWETYYYNVRIPDLDFILENGEVPKDGEAPEDFNILFYEMGHEPEDTTYISSYNGVEGKTTKNVTFSPEESNKPSNPSNSVEAKFSSGSKKEMAKYHLVYNGIDITTKEIVIEPEITPSDDTIKDYYEKGVKEFIPNNVTIEKIKEKSKSNNNESIFIDGVEYIWIKK